jgi:hypothetical protein
MTCVIKANFHRPCGPVDTIAGGTWVPLSCGQSWAGMWQRNPIHVLIQGGRYVSR